MCAKARGRSYSVDRKFFWETVCLDDGHAVRVVDTSSGAETVRDARYCDYYSAREAARTLRDYYNRTGRVV